MNNPKYNSSGCRDMTAYEAIKHVSDEDREACKLIKKLKAIIREEGFEVVGRIVIKNEETGRVFR